MGDRNHPDRPNPPTMPKKCLSCFKRRRHLMALLERTRHIVLAHRALQDCHTHDVLVNRARILYNIVMKPNTCESVKSLRHSLGLSQQAFATKLGLSIRAVVNYEKDRAPSAKALARLEKLATDNEEPALARIFRDALGKELGLGMSDRSPLSGEELLLDRAFRRCVFENPRSAEAIKIRKLLRRCAQQINAEDALSSRILDRNRSGE
jgi:transcriptional regulator with XRE-family HTH domain